MASIDDRRWKRDAATGRRVASGFRGDKPYRLRWREYPGGPQKSEHFARKVDAEDRLIEVEHSLRSGTYIDPAAGRMLFSAWWERWHAHRPDLEGSTVDRIDIFWRHQIGPALGHVPLSAIDRALLRDWVGKMSKAGVAPRSIRKAVQLVGQALAVAMEDRLIATNPAERLRGLPKVLGSEAQFCSVDEVAALVAATDERFRPLVQTAVWSGLRLGELTGLRRRSVDLLRRRIEVVETITEVRGQMVHKKYGKTGAARRTVPIPSHLVDVLTAHMPGLGPNDLVFTSAEGTPLRRSNLHAKVWQPATIAAGLGERVERPTEAKPKRTLYEGLRFHDLRHTAVSFWISAGADYTQLKKWAGHESVATLIDTYGHLMPDREAPVIEALEALAATAGVAAKVATVTPIGAASAGA